tara:strand:+ start:7909 stop:8190 length:282 start_codon:yes stop_codon:yes gene_type:complete
MPGIGRTILDMGGGGLILGPGSTSVFCESQKLSLVGDGLTTHGEPPHTSGSSLVANGSATVFSEGKPVTVAGISIATCAHPISPGSPTVFVGA